MTLTCPRVHAHLLQPRFCRPRFCRSHYLANFVTLLPAPLGPASMPLQATAPDSQEQVNRRTDGARQQNAWQSCSQRPAEPWLPGRAICVSWQEVQAGCVYWRRFLAELVLDQQCSQFIHIRRGRRPHRHKIASWRREHVNEQAWWAHSSAGICHLPLSSMLPCARGALLQHLLDELICVNSNDINSVRPHYCGRVFCMLGSRRWCLQQPGWMSCVTLPSP